ncbi:MAG: acetyl-CoA carboxylase biotin carboxyl carrier protein subunit [Deltaproteobacteria bacterium]|nr:acetyl-CoA carboxylase biotin carboxyl carrier protein subunit [Deltaproteobacteria bacterium]
MEKKIQHLIIDDTKYETEIPEGYIRKVVQQPAGKKDIRAVIPGKVSEVRVRKGQMMAKGDVAVILEAMKMLNAIEAEADGRVTEILVSAGDRVAKGHLMIRME